MFGSHLSIAGSMLKALTQAQALGLDTVQVFTKNQQQWKAPPLDPAIVRDWRAEIARLGWQGRTVSHASYLINLASIKDDLWAKSIDLMTDEIERCQALGIAYLVHHPGSHVGSDLATGMSRIEQAYRELFKRTKGYTVVSCFEGTVSAGSTLGGPFEHLRELRERAAAATGAPERIAFCLDSCHLHAAGHDLSTAKAAKETIDRFDEICGVSNVRVWHLNDSKGALGSKLDRHAHIGEGEVGGGTPGQFSPASLKASGFTTIVRDPRFKNIPKILETPKGDDPMGVPFDAINLSRLKGLTAPAKPPRLSRS